MARQFGGSRLEALTQLCLQCYGVGTLCAYASVFGSSVASWRVEQCDPSVTLDVHCLETYDLSVMVFGAVVVALSFVDFGDQRIFQATLSAYRIASLVTVIVTALLKICQEDGLQKVSERAQTIGFFNYRSFGYGLGPTLLALNCQYNMPDVLQPLRNKSEAPYAAFGAQAVAALLYVCLGLVTALAFDEVHPLATLNWRYYGIHWGSSSFLSKYILRTLVLFSPVANVLSAYPLVGRTLAENGLAALGSGVARTPKTVNCARLLTTVPPILLAVIFKHLATVFSITGLFGLIVGLSVPAMLQIGSLLYCRRHFGVDPAATLTPYSSKCIPPSTSLASLYLAFTLFATAIAVITLFLSARPASAI